MKTSPNDARQQGNMPCTHYVVSFSTVIFTCHSGWIFYLLYFVYLSQVRFRVMQHSIGKI